MSRRIARAAEKRRMAEGQQAGVADQEIEGAGEQREAQGLHQKHRIDEKRRRQPKQH